MFSEACQRDAGDYLGRASRPTSLGFDPLQTFEEPAEVDQQPREVVAHRLQRLIDAAPGSDTPVGGGCWVARAAAVDLWRSPVRAGAWQHRSKREIAPQPLAGFVRGGVDQRGAVSTATPGHPGEGALGGVAEYGYVAARIDNQIEMLSETGNLARPILSSQPRPPRITQHEPLPPPPLALGEARPLQYLPGGGGETSAPEGDTRPTASQDQHLRLDRIGERVGSCFGKLAQQPLGFTPEPDSDRCCPQPSGGE